MHQKKVKCFNTLCVEVPQSPKAKENNHFHHLQHTVSPRLSATGHIPPYAQATVQQANRRTPRRRHATSVRHRHRRRRRPRLFTIIAQQFHIAKKNRIFIVAASHTLQKLFCISFPCVSIIGFYQKIIIKPFDYANSETHTSVSPVVKQQCLIMLFEKSGMLRPGLAMPFLLNSTVQLSRNSV